MSNSEDLEAIHQYFARMAASAKNAEASAEVAAWGPWYAGLGWYDKTLSDSVLAEAKTRRDRLNKALGQPDLVAMGYKPADKQPAIDVAKEFAGGGKPPVTKKGQRGAAVRKLQLAIGVTPADGNFGPGTEAALKKWQAAHGITADGIAGPATWGAIGVKTVSDIVTPPPGVLTPLAAATHAAASQASAAVHAAAVKAPAPKAGATAVKAPAAPVVSQASIFSLSGTPMKVGLGLTAAAIAYKVISDGGHDKKKRER